MFTRCPSRVPRPCPPGLEALEDRLTPSTLFQVTKLVSDQAHVAQIQDRNLVNAWGIGLDPKGGDFWVSSNGKDVSELYAGDVGGTKLQHISLTVKLPGGEPTGQVFNRTHDFVIHAGAAKGPALFLTASESGHITGWSPNVGPATSAVDAAFVKGAIYKGLALVHNTSGNFLLAPDFHNGHIDVFDENFHRTHLAGSLRDKDIPAGFAPFNVQVLGKFVYVTYAKQDADKHDDVKGAGNGFVDVYDTNGRFVSHLVKRGALNSPWGLAIAPSNFGQFRGDLLVGNFGDGKINAFDAKGHLVGTLQTATGKPLVIDGLWGLTPGNGTSAGDKTALYFSAGPGGEAHGLFGKITVKA